MFIFPDIHNTKQSTDTKSWKVSVYLKQLPLFNDKHKTNDKYTSNVKGANTVNVIEMKSNFVVTHW
jgi:hypothetical protein